MLRPFRRLALLPILLAGLATACGTEPATPERPVVIVSVLPQAWFVQQLAGDAVDVEVMIPPGASPATHEPTFKQMRAVARARLYVKVGHPSFPFERAWLDELLAEGPRLRVVDGSEGLAAEAPGDDHGHGHGHGDPHVWLAPDHARALARNVAAGLRELLPDRSADIDRRLTELESRIDATTEEVRTILTPVRGQRFFVFHPAWGHFANAHGLRQVAVEEHGREPDPGRLARLVVEAREANVRVIFTQPQFSEQAAATVAADAGARVESLDPLAADWAENQLRVARAIAAEAVP